MYLMYYSNLCLNKCNTFFMKEILKPLTLTAIKSTGRLCSRIYFPGCAHNALIISASAYSHFLCILLHGVYE